MVQLCTIQDLTPFPHFGVKAGKVYTAKISVPGSEVGSLSVKPGQVVNVK